MPLLSADNLVKYALAEENPEALNNAINALNNRDVFLVGFSGKKASGKDTLAEIFTSKFEEKYGQASYSPFAQPLKGEATSIISFIHTWAHGTGFGDEASMLERLGSIYDLSTEQTRTIYDLLLPDILVADTPFDGWTRTETVWTFLRTLGTDIRQPQDKIYWVRRTVHAIISNANNGISTIVQDVRFLHEVEALKDVGAYVARVDITPEAQARRLSGRDGVVADEAARQHKSETGLDDYENFDIRVDNSTDGEQEKAAATIYEDWVRKVSPRVK
jgi:dephospho-CoA kinase